MLYISQYSIRTTSCSRQHFTCVISLDINLLNVVTTVLKVLVERMSGCGRGLYSGIEVITAGHFLQSLRPPLQTTVPAIASALLSTRKLSSITAHRYCTVFCLLSS